MGNGSLLWEESLLAPWFILPKSYSYIGIGTDIIAKSFISQMSYHDFVMKWPIDTNMSSLRGFLPIYL